MWCYTFQVLKKDEAGWSDQLLGIGVASISVKERPGEQCELMCHTVAEQTIEALLDRIPYEKKMIEEADWQYRWLEDHEGIEVNDSLYIQCGGSPPPKAYPYVIKCDPRDAFGDGRHATTQLCLSYLYEDIQSHEPSDYQSCCDVGTGTGILALAASRLGVSDVVGFDCEPASIRRAKANARLNEMDSVTFCEGNVATFQCDKPVNLLLANVLTDVHVAYLETYKQWCLPGARLILSGVLQEWESHVLTAIKESGLRCLDKRVLNDWCAFYLAYDG